MNETSPIVLVVDDETQIRRFLRTGFELNGFVVQEAATGAEAIRSATLRPIDLMIVDLGLPDMDGSEIVKRIRSWSTIPIIVLSVRATEAQKVQLLEVGADDYVVKPFGMAELLARVRVALRRQMRAVTLNGARLTLTPKEYRLLQVLAQHAGNVVTHQHLLKEVWGSIHVHDTHYLRIFVRKLRQKIEPHPDSPKILMTELGVGYRLAQSGEAESSYAAADAPAKSEG